MTRHVLKITPANREKALSGIEIALRRYKAGDAAWTLELRESRRSDEQNDALHSLIDQILKQRPIHNGIKMDKALWKATFMQALGEEIRFIPTLEGDGLFPLGLSTRELNKARFSELITLILAWTAREGIVIQHFEEKAA